MGIGTTILQPGAYGTNFLGNCIQPKDAALIDQQPPVKAMFDAFGKGFEDRAKAGQLGDPTEIFAAVVELVEMDKSKRPLRKTVGDDIQQAVVPINQRCAEVQDHLLRAFGLR
jgi:hypothetical protein